MLALGMQQSQEGCGPSLPDIQDEMEMHTSTQNVHVVCSVPQEGSESAECTGGGSLLFSFPDPPSVGPYEC